MCHINNSQLLSTAATVSSKASITENNGVKRYSTDTSAADSVAPVYPTYFNELFSHFIKSKSKTPSFSEPNVIASPTLRKIYGLSNPTGAREIPMSMSTLSKDLHNHYYVHAINPNNPAKGERIHDMLNNNYTKVAQGSGYDGRKDGLYGVVIMTQTESGGIHTPFLSIPHLSTLLNLADLGLEKDRHQMFFKSSKKAEVTTPVGVPNCRIEGVENDDKVPVNVFAYYDKDEQKLIIRDEDVTFEFIEKMITNIQALLAGVDNICRELNIECGQNTSAHEKLKIIFDKIKKELVTDEKYSFDESIVDAKLKSQLRDISNVLEKQCRVLGTCYDLAVAHQREDIAKEAVATKVILAPDNSDNDISLNDVATLMTDSDNIGGEEISEVANNISYMF